jgi:hypothetical protein
MRAGCGAAALPAGRCYCAGGQQGIGEGPQQGSCPLLTAPAAVKPPAHEPTRVLAALHHVGEVLLLRIAQRLELLHRVDVHLRGGAASSLGIRTALRMSVVPARLKMKGHWCAGLAKRPCQLCAAAPLRRAAALVAAPAGPRATGCTHAARANGALARPSPAAHFVLGLGLWGLKGAGEDGHLSGHAVDAVVLSKAYATAACRGGWGRAGAVRGCRLGRHLGGHTEPRPGQAAAPAPLPAQQR